VGEGVKNAVEIADIRSHSNSHPFLDDPISGSSIRDDLIPEVLDFAS
jgi:hypothetical protein